MLKHVEADRSEQRDAGGYEQGDGHAGTDTEENLRAAVDTILTNAVGEQEAREKAGRAKTARMATRQLREVIRREAVAATEMAEAHEAQMETAMMRSPEQTVSDGQHFNPEEEASELLAQVKVTEVAESYKAQRGAEQLNARNATAVASMVAESRTARMHGAEHLVGPTGIPEKQMLLRQAAQVVEARRAVEHELQLRHDSESSRRQSADDGDQLAKALAESQADSERRKLAQEAKRRTMQMALDASELDAEQKNTEEDQVAVVVRQSKRAAEQVRPSRRRKRYELHGGRHANAGHRRIQAACRGVGDKRAQYS